MTELSRAERYIFIIALVALVLVYFVGAEGLIKTGGPIAIQGLEVAQGRSTSGTYAPYASGPTS